MTQEFTTVNTIAPLKNVALVSKVMERIIKRPPHLPGIGVVAGFSGVGKSQGAIQAALKYRACYVEVRSSWTKRALLEAICLELRIPSHGPVYKLVSSISEKLAQTQQPLIIDEMDHIVKRSAVEIVRDIHDGSNAPILLIGEEHMPRHLNKWERFHGRVLEWQYAQPADAQDAKVLTTFYCKKVRIADDLLHEVARVCKGSVRRICINLALIEEKAKRIGQEEIDLSKWGNTPFYTGDPQEARP